VRIVGEFDSYRLRAKDYAERAKATDRPRLKTLMTDLQINWNRLARELERTHAIVGDNGGSKPR